MTTTAMAKPHPVDIHVGEKIRQIRKLRGLSQMKLAEAIGITFQQIQKYENGTNRVCASRLDRICKVLSVQPNSFFEGYADATTTQRGSGRDIFDLTNNETREVLKLVRAFVAIGDKETRKHFLLLVQKAAGQ